MDRANKEIWRKENWEHIATENGILFPEDKAANEIIRVCSPVPNLRSSIVVLCIDSQQPFLSYKSIFSKLLVYLLNIKKKFFCRCSSKLLISFSILRIFLLIIKTHPPFT